MLWQPPLPKRYTNLPDDQLITEIDAQRADLGDQLVILGHHYQQDDVIRFADFTGDSFKLSQLAAERVKEVGAKYVIFCGVHFMAESATSSLKTMWRWFYQIYPLAVQWRTWRTTRTRLTHGSRFITSWRIEIRPWSLFAT